MATAYERELKGILSGDEAVLRKKTKALPPEATKGYLQARDKPFLMIRGAGSLGVDLVALRGDVSFPIEVKSAAKDVIHFSDASGKNNEQAENMRVACSRASVIPLYAFRLKGVRGDDAWRIFTLPTENLPPRIKILYDRVPKIERTPEGNYVLRWKDGIPLHKFLDYLC